MTRPVEQVELVRALHADGLNHCEIAARTGIPRSTVREWIAAGIDDHVARRRAATSCGDGSTCERRDAVPPVAYAYLLGQYLGDGCISRQRRGVFRLRVACCNDYPVIMDEVQRAMTAVMPQSKVGRVAAEGWTEVGSSSKHWPCLLPQHGPGRKHDRLIALDPWQQAIVAVETKEFVRGLIHSDGCRCINRVKGGEYPRYLFTNRSADILDLYCAALDQLGVQWRVNNPGSVSVARRESVAALDAFVGPKR